MALEPQRTTRASASGEGSTCGAGKRIRGADAHFGFHQRGQMLFQLADAITQLHHVVLWPPSRERKPFPITSAGGRAGSATSVSFPSFRMVETTRIELWPCRRNTG
jgi:hypothetical protein